MENIPVFMIVNLKINNSDEYRIYEKGFSLFLRNTMDHLLHLMITRMS